MKTNIWENYQEEQKQQVMTFSQEYKQFLSHNKTERECVKFAVQQAEANGFSNLKDLIKLNKHLKAGDKVYAVNMDKSIVLFVVGEQPMNEGINIIGAHIDSPRLDIKSTPLYESAGFCMLDTHYYGGIKKYQWTARPLAIHGVVCKKDGSKIDVVWGEADEPVLVISDLLPHLQRDDKKDIKGEDLNLIAGNIGDTSAEKEHFNQTIKNILKQKNIDAEDLYSAELEVVPAGPARDCGLDNSMILGYGHDDKVCAYTVLRAILTLDKPQVSAMCMLVDKEEIGSVGATGMHSKYFENAIAEIMNLCGQYSELNMRRALNNSNMLSSDVTAGVDPNFMAPFNTNTDAHCAKGIAFCKYTGYAGKAEANDANPEFIAKIRQCMDENKVAYQFTEMGRVDQGGGGTIAYIMAKYGMNVIDAGVPVLNMHAPCEIASKADIFEAYKCYETFYKNFK